MLIPLANIYNFIIGTSRRLNIDETHGLRHAMDVYKYSQNLYNVEKINTPLIIQDERLIYTSALLHDMCDHKYIREEEGLSEIDKFLRENAYYRYEIDIVKDIISTMSYSKIRVKGEPNHGENQAAFQIVRESDLLTSYDVDRCVMYDMLKNDIRYEIAFKNAKGIFEGRMFKYLERKEIRTEAGKKIAKRLEEGSKERIKEIEKTISNNRIKNRNI